MKNTESIGKFITDQKLALDAVISELTRSQAEVNRLRSQHDTLERTADAASARIANTERRNGELTRSLNEALQQKGQSDQRAQTALQEKNVALQQRAQSDQRAQTAETALEKSRRPPDDQVQLCPECKDSNFNQKLATVLDHRQVHVAVMALAGAGKSSFFNNVARALNGRKVPAIRSVGASTVEGGQHSTIISREDVVKHMTEKGLFCSLLFTDSVGFTGGQSELISIGKGLLKSNEIWPRDDSEESNLKRSEILNRNPQAPHVTTFIVLISIQDLWNGSPANDNIIKGIIETAKTKFKINGMPVEVPVIIAITKCDEHTTNPHFNNLLGQRNSDNLAPIFKKATERFGIPQDNIIALGWQDESDQTDWSFGSQDPRAMVVRHTLYQLTTSSAMCHDRLGLDEKPHHAQAHDARLRDVYAASQQGNNGDDDDTEEVPAFDLPSASQVGGGSASMASDARTLTHSVVQRRAQRATFEKEVRESGVSRKEFVSDLSPEDLARILHAKKVGTRIIDAILGEGYTGDVFVEDEFIADGFTEEILTKYNINKLFLSSFVRIRNALLAA